MISTVIELIMNNINNKLCINNWNNYPLPRKPNDADMALFFVIVFHLIFITPEYHKRVS